MKILLIHPEGNINYNASLTAFVEVLAQAGHFVSYVGPQRPKLDQRLPYERVEVVLLENRYGRHFIFPDIEALVDGGPVPDYERWAGFDLVLAVDRGIIQGSWIARHFGIPHALISYEIFFADETSAEFKAPEIDACRDLAFVVVQDSLRARKICMENRICPDKVVQIPVAARGFIPPIPKPRLLHRMLKLPAHTKVALYMGSFSEWTDSEYLLESTRHWPSDWTLVIHERFGLSSANGELIEKLGDSKRIRIAQSTFSRVTDMSEYIQSADLGVALYSPTYENAWVGRNLDNIGLASGKISAYLQHGVPVATHELGEITDWIRHYGAGQIFSLDEPFVPQMPDESGVDACRRLFEQHLDFERFAPALLRAVANARRDSTGYPLPAPALAAVDH